MRFFFVLPVPMRTAPTVSASNLVIETYNGQGTETFSSLSQMWENRGSSEQILTLQNNSLTKNFTVGIPCNIRLGNHGYIEFSADL